jgi:hypothetical protein
MSNVNWLANRYFANARNAAAGSVRQLDSSIAASRGLDAFWYYLVNARELNLHVHSESLNYLDKLGFRTNKERRILHGIEEVIAYIREYTEKRPTLGYDIDGLVFKVDNIDDYDVLGYTAKTPRGRSPTSSRPPRFRPSFSILSSRLAGRAALPRTRFLNLSASKARWCNGLLLIMKTSLKIKA